MKLLFAYSIEDSVSLGVADELKSLLGMEHDMEINGNRHFIQGDGIEMIELGTSLVNADYVEGLVKADLIVFLSRHRSAKGVTAFTVHPEGNWGTAAELGGRPKELGVSSPVNMLRFMRCLKAAASEAGSDAQVVYEATHHGPLLKTPSFFAELGGNQEAMDSTKLRSALADAAFRFTHPENDTSGYSKIVVHIGGLHYSGRATQLAMEKGYAFAHIMPKYYVAETDMLQQAMKRSDMPPELALVEWKSINADKRNMVLDKLKELGIDYERV
jgi:D-aminoacyl-tRNA deacylase